MTEGERIARRMIADKVAELSRPRVVAPELVRKAAIFDRWRA